MCSVLFMFGFVRITLYIYQRLVLLFLLLNIAYDLTPYCHQEDSCVLQFPGTCLLYQGCLDGNCARDHLHNLGLHSHALDNQSPGLCSQLHMCFGFPSLAFEFPKMKKGKPACHLSNLGWHLHSANFTLHCWVVEDKVKDTFFARTDSSKWGLLAANGGVW